MKLPAPDRWSPWPVEKITAVFPDLPWILAGGLALEMFVGRRYRRHADVDILINREDQKRLPRYLEDGSQIFIGTGAGRLVPFSRKSGFVRYPVQDLWLLGEDRAAWALQIMLYDTEDGCWIYKRNKNIRLSVDRLFRQINGIRVIRPEIQLLYKSRAPRPKDELDFAAVRDLLDRDARKWLDRTLRQCYGRHRWLADEK